MISGTIERASKETGVGEDRIRDAIKRGDLEAHYVGVKAIVLADDLAEWIRTLPTERKERTL